MTWGSFMLVSVGWQMMLMVINADLNEGMINFLGVAGGSAISSRAIVSTWGSFLFVFVVCNFHLAASHFSIIQYCVV